MRDKLFANLLANKNLYGTIVVAMFCITLANYFPIRINLTRSMPRGIYYFTPHSPIHLGNYVMICLGNSLAHSALQHGYLRAGTCRNGIQPLLKQIAAMKGDLVVLSTSKVIINGKALPHSATLTHDQHGRVVHTIARGIFKLNTNQVWVYGSDSEKSWDSRYFGPIESREIISIVKPFIIEAKDH